MASSVSSERAFSSAGITISKCRNRLKADIVEALQCLSLYHNNLIFHDTVDTAHVEQEMEQLECVLDGSYGNQDTVDLDDKEEWSWDQLVNDDSDGKDNNQIIYTVMSININYIHKPWPEPKPGQAKPRPRTLALA